MHKFCRWAAGRDWCLAGCLAGYLALMANTGFAMGLMVEPSTAQCGVTAPQPVLLPAAQAGKRLAGSLAVSGSKDITWAWLGTPTMRYPHAALGGATHAGSLHVLVQLAGKPAVNQAIKQAEVVLDLPVTRVFEDRVPRLVDLDGDGRDEIVLIESDILRGSALVVYGLKRDGLKSNRLVELARSAATGSTFRWMNPVGVADFDGDGKLDIASVITPHIGGLLTLYKYAPPKLEPFAQAMDTSNHRMGDSEQQLGVIVELKGLRPTIIVPDMQLKALHALRWESNNTWKELADAKPLPAAVKRITPLPSGGCILLTDASWWRVWLTQ